MTLVGVYKTAMGLVPINLVTVITLVLWLLFFCCCFCVSTIKLGFSPEGVREVQHHSDGAYFSFMWL